MEFKPGYDSRNYHHDGKKVCQFMTIDGQRFGRVSIELCDRVGRVIGYRSVSSLQRLRRAHQTPVED